MKETDKGQKLRFGAQTYAWQMSGDKYRGEIPHILEVCSRAGFTGLEIETSMLGGFERKPAELKKQFEERGMELAAVGVPVGWGIADRKELICAAETSFRAAEGFEGALMSFSLIPPQKKFEEKTEEQKRFLACLTELKERAERAGYRASFHTNSSPASLFWSEGDYRILKGFFEDTGMGFTPDAGHIAHGGMDVETVFDWFLPHICHVHFKDMAADGTWMPMGAGGIPFLALIRRLNGAGYRGWVLVEEESARAVKEPDAVMLRNGRYIQQMLCPEPAAPDLPI